MVRPSYVWMEIDTRWLSPRKVRKQMPAEYTATCNCKIRCTVRCKCVTYFAQTSVNVETKIAIMISLNKIYFLMLIFK